MAHNDIEIEIQVNVEKVQPLLKFLKTNGEYVDEKHQADEYFTPAHRNFIGIRPVEEWLRLRDAGGKHSINYKKYHYDKKGKALFCDEYETKIESADQAKKILSALNSRSLVKVDKIRKTWTYKDYEISIDSVKKLGDFVEVEYIGKNAKVSPKKVTQEMIAFLKKVGCGKITRNFVGYPFLMLFPKEVKYKVQ